MKFSAQADQLLIALARSPLESRAPEIRHQAELNAIERAERFQMPAEVEGPDVLAACACFPRGLAFCREVLAEALEMP